MKFVREPRMNLECGGEHAQGRGREQRPMRRGHVDPNSGPYAVDPHRLHDSYDSRLRHGPVGKPRGITTGDDIISAVATTAPVHGTVRHNSFFASHG